MTKQPTITQRLVLYPIVALIFVFFSTLIVLSALGYDIRYSKGQLSLKKTGLIILATRPGDAQVYIDGKLYRKRTPGFSLFTLKISKVSPGSHLVKIEKDGYEPWEGQFNVESGLVSWGNYILFVPIEKKASNFSFPGNLTALMASEDKTKGLALVESKDGIVSFWNITTQNKEKIRIFETRKLEGETFRLHAYSEGEDRIIFTKTINGKISYYVLDAKEGSTPLDITSTFGVEIDKIVFNGRNSSELFYLRSGNLYSIDLQSKKVSAILEKDVFEIISNNQALLMVAKVEDNYGLWRLEANGSKTNIIKNLPSSGEYQIDYLPETKTYAILSKKDSDLYVFTDVSGKSNLRRIDQGVSYFLASPRSKYIGYAKGDSFLTYELEKDHAFEAIKNKKITSIAWLSDESNLIYQEAGRLYLVNYNGFYDKYLFDTFDQLPAISGLNSLNIYFSRKLESGLVDLSVFTFAG